MALYDALVEYGYDRRDKGYTSEVLVALIEERIRNKLLTEPFILKAPVYPE